jgi:hypothetical protein
MLSPASLSYLSVEKVIFIRKGHIGKKEQKNKELTFRHGFALLPTVLYQAYQKLLE